MKKEWNSFEWSEQSLAPTINQLICVNGIHRKKLMLVMALPSLLPFTHWIYLYYWCHWMNQQIHSIINLFCLNSAMNDKLFNACIECASEWLNVSPLKWIEWMVAFSQWMEVGYGQLPILMQPIHFSFILIHSISCI